MGDAGAKKQDVSLDEAMSIAILFQQNRRLDDAQTVYQQILEAAPDHVDALHFSGVLAHQQGRSDEGIALIWQSLQLDPQQADAWSNLGIVLKSCGRLDEAIEAHERAIDLNPQHANACNNLGVAHKLKTQYVEAERCYRRAIELNPKHVDAYTNLGSLLARLKRTKEAVECYCRVTTLYPKHPEARRLLALAHCTLGEVDKAAKIFEEWLAQEPDHPVARHMLAACSGRDVPDRAADAYVEKVFDDFAPSFEEKLHHLSYRAPELVTEMLKDAGVDAAGALDVLDAGCGTGLCGPLLQPFARRLVGVDLSAGMLDVARDKQVYHELVKAELTAYLQSCAESFDVIVSADTLVYFGRIDDACTAVAAALRPAGRLIFTVEERREDAGATDFAIRTHGRYQHDRAYVERVLVAAGLEPRIVSAELRMESGMPVAGLVVCGVKPAAADMEPAHVARRRSDEVRGVGDRDA